MKYDRSQFLEFFDTEKQINEGAEWYQYALKRNDNILRITVYVFEEEVSIVGNTLISFTLHDIEHIECTETSGIAKILFHQKNKKYPTVTIFIKPHINIYLNIDQVEEDLI